MTSRGYNMSIGTTTRSNNTIVLASATPIESGDLEPEPTATGSDYPEPTGTGYSEDPEPTSTDSVDSAPVVSSEDEGHTGLIIGMAVVIPVISFALCLLFFYLARRTRRKQRELDTGIPVTRVIEVTPESTIKPSVAYQQPLTYQQPILYANGMPVSDRVDTPQPTFMESFDNSGLVMAENKIGHAYSNDHGYGSLVSSPAAESPRSPTGPVASNLPFTQEAYHVHEQPSHEERYITDDDSAVSSVYEIRR